MAHQYHYIIIGSGIIGLAIARSLKSSDLNTTILIIDKEAREACHASSRNSGVLHAGFYYTADSLKAKFTVDGNQRLKQYCHQHNIPLNECGKLVVAKNEAQLNTLYELENRGKKNGSRVFLIDEHKALELEGNVRTFQKALYSPDTATVDPQKVCSTMKAELSKAGVQFQFHTKYLGRKDTTLLTNKGEFTAKKIINCAGLYADKIAQDFGMGLEYTMIPFKGIYWKYTTNDTDISMHIYPVPNPKNSFLGVHFTKTVTGGITIGPTAIPAFWRENYTSWENFKLDELLCITAYEARLFLTNNSNFRDLALDEIKKYRKKYFVHQAKTLVRNIDENGFTEQSQPGIRAQLLNKKRLHLINDFIIEADQHSVHILNAVSPAFTCSLPFADYVVRKYILN